MSSWRVDLVNSIRDRMNKSSQAVPFQRRGKVRHCRRELEEPRFPSLAGLTWLRQASRRRNNVGSTHQEGRTFAS